MKILNKVRGTKVDEFYVEFFFYNRVLCRWSWQSGTGKNNENKLVLHPGCVDMTYENGGHLEHKRPSNIPLCKLCGEDEDADHLLFPHTVAVHAWC